MGGCVEREKKCTNISYQDLCTKYELTNISNGKNDFLCDSIIHGE